MDFAGDKIRNMTKIWNAGGAMKELGWGSRVVTDDDGGVSLDAAEAARPALQSHPIARSERFRARGAPNALAEDVQQIDYSRAITGNPGDAAKTCRSLGGSLRWVERFLRLLD